MSTKIAIPTPGLLAAWEKFWFTPADPTLLGFIRLTCGVITFYTLAMYTLNLADFMGPNAWHDLNLRMEVVRNRAVMVPPLDGQESASMPAPSNDFEKGHFDRYFHEFKVHPIPPYPQTHDEDTYIVDYRKKYGFDLRRFGLAPPDAAKRKHIDYLEKYTDRWGAPPPAYPETEEEEQAVAQYMEKNGADPRMLYTRGMTAFSLWFHVTDPRAMMAAHLAVVLASFFLMVGFCTRVMSVVTWFGFLSYIHRNPTALFGADTMMVILLTYLMIGPSGGALSVDRLIAAWWSRAKPGVIHAWCRLLGRPLPADADIAPATYDPQPTPTVSANVAVRLLQIHLCIIYLIAGLSKLLGPSWWSGHALWSVLANYEFAPMHFEAYNRLLRLLGRNQLVFETFLTGGAIFTLVFEIGYAFLIWRPLMRRPYLLAALLLHGLIGVLMGLKTFALIMLVMNFAFLSRGELDWFLSWFGRKPPESAAPAAIPVDEPPVSAIPAGNAKPVGSSTAVKRR